MSVKRIKKEPKLVWNEEANVLTLEGEPVLSYRLKWPELEHAGLGGRWISKYYVHQARCWRLRWQREVYWQACLHLVQRRAESKPFVPWSGKLEGEEAAWENGVLSLRFRGEETRGAGKTNRVRWGDAWKVAEGAPCTGKELLGGVRGWKKDGINQLVEQGRARKQAGEWIPDRDWEGRIRSLFPKCGLCLTPEGVEASFPQGSIAPCAEGTPVFLLHKSAPNEKRPDPGEKKEKPQGFFKP